jgi:hypothetical protein
MCVSLRFICNQMVRQMQAYHAKELRAQQFQTEELRHQLDDKLSVKELSRDARKVSKTLLKSNRRS